MSASIIDLLTVLGIVTETEARRNRIPGLERAVPKAKGVEFASLLHQFAADFALSPNSTKLRPILLQIDPEVKERLAKRLAKPAEAPPPPPAEPRRSKPRTSESAPAGGGQPGKEEASSKRRRREVPAGEGSSKAQDASADQAANPDPAPKPSATKQLSKKKPR